MFPAGAPGFIPRAMRSYRRSRKLTESTKTVGTMTDAEYQAAKRKLLVERDANRRAADDAAELKRIEERFAARKEAKP